MNKDNLYIEDGKVWDNEKTQYWRNKLEPLSKQTLIDMIADMESFVGYEKEIINSKESEPENIDDLLKCFDEILLCELENKYGYTDDGAFDHIDNNGIEETRGEMLKEVLPEFVAAQKADIEWINEKQKSRIEKLEEIIGNVKIILKDEDPIKCDRLTFIFEGISNEH